MKQLLAACVGGAVLITWAAWQPQARLSSSPVRDDTNAVLVHFGVTDTEPTVWNGDVSIADGEIVTLSSWRPLPGEAIDGQRAWKLSSTWSDAFQNRAWEHEPMTPYRPVLRKPGLVIEVRGAKPVLRINTPHGQFTAGLKNETFLNGRVRVERVPSPVRLSAEDRENEHVALARGLGHDMWLGWVTYRTAGNEILVRRHDGRGWSAAETLTAKLLGRVPRANRSRRESRTVGDLERTGQRQLGLIWKTAPRRFLGSGGTADGGAATRHSSRCGIRLCRKLVAGLARFSKRPV